MAQGMNTKKAAQQAITATPRPSAPALRRALRSWALSPGSSAGQAWANTIGRARGRPELLLARAAA
jgi:hypothetical protein